MRKIVLNWEVEAMYQALFRDVPSSRSNPFVMERYSLYTQIEDPSERAPALSALFDIEDYSNVRCTHINPVDALHYRPKFFLTGVRK